MRSGTRMVSIDAMRFIASIAVIPLHATDTPDLVRQGCRFAVPFFFVTSGYFLGRRDFQKPWSIIRTLFVRLFPVFIVWLGVFWWLALYTSFASNWAEKWSLYGVLGSLSTGGPAYHLWFLPSLGLCILILVGGLQITHRLWVLFGFAIVLYLCGLMLRSYHVVFFGPGTEHGRNGPFLFLYVLIGFWLYRSGLQLRSGAAIALCAGGFGLQLAEAYWLSSHHYAALGGTEYLVGTVPFGVGVFLIALSVRSESQLTRICAYLGRYALGIYAVHPIFLWLFEQFVLRDFLDSNRAADFLLLVVMSTIASTAAALLMGRIRFLRPLSV